MPKPFYFAFTITIGPGMEDTGSQEDTLQAAESGPMSRTGPSESSPFFEYPTLLDTRAALPTAVPGQLDTNGSQGSPILQGPRPLALGVALRKPLEEGPPCLPEHSTVATQGL